MFGDDPFDRLVREFFGQNADTSRQNNLIENEDDERNIDFLEDEKHVYLIFELPGFEEKDVAVSVKSGEIIVKAKGNVTESTDDYIANKITSGQTITKILPKFVNHKGYKTTFRNGILEVVFNKNEHRR